MKIGGFHTPTPIHDPSVYVGENDTYYIFGTHMAAAESKDLRYWESFAEGVNAQNPLFDNLYDDISDYYYLFVSFGWLAREGGYQICLFHSKKLEGPYVDMEGKTFRRVNHHDPYGLKLLGNYIFPSMECGYKSPGHNSAFKDQNGKIYIVYHQRFEGGERGA